jgi:hypothetical protein
MGVNLSRRSWQSLASKPGIRKFAFDQVKKFAENGYRKNLDHHRFSVGECEDRYAMSQAIIDTAERILTALIQFPPAYIRKLADIMVNTIVIEGGEISIQQSFKALHGRRPPGFMVISPTKACNLKCKGCYASSSEVSIERLDWMFLIAFLPKRVISSVFASLSSVVVSLLPIKTMVKISWIWSKNMMTYSSWLTPIAC